MTLIAGILLASVIGTGFGQANAVDETAIKALIAAYAAARDQQDPAQIGRLFTADADQLVSSGEWRRGSDAVVRGTIASSQRTGGSRRLVVETVRLVGPDVAIADARYEITNAAAGTRRMWSTFVVRRTREGWRIAAIRNMLPAPPAPAAPR